MAHGPANGGSPVGIGTAATLALWNSAQVLVAGPAYTISTNALLANGPFINVKAAPYNAIGNGVADDSAAIQAAINALQPGGTVFFPSGTYKVSTTLTMTTFHIQLVGDSKQDCILKTASGTNDILQMNSWYCSVSNLTFDSSVTRTAGYAVKMTTGNSRHVVQNCEFDNMFNGVQMQSHISAINGAEFRTFAAGGSWIEISAPASAAHDFFITNVTGDNGTNAASTAGINLTQCSSLILTDSSLVHGGALGALYINPGAGQVVPSVFVSNVFFDQSGYGVQMAGNASGTIQRCSFLNSWFTQATNDGVLLNQANAQGIMFTNCQFFGSVNGINALTAQEWQVSNSEFGGNTSNGIKTTAVAGMTFGIYNNFIGSVAGFGANANGINIQAGTYSAYTVQGNRGLDTNTAGGIIDSGAVTGFKQKFVQDNGGATFRGKLAAIIAASAGINSTETIVVGGLNNCPIPANSLQIGDTFRITLIGTCTTSAGNVSTFAVRIGTAGTTSDTLILTAATLAAALTGTTVPFRAILEFTVRSLGSGTSATVAGSLTLINEGVAADAANLGIATTNTQVVAFTATGFNSTVNNYLEATYKAAAATTTCTFQNAIIEKL